MATMLPTDVYEQIKDKYLSGNFPFRRIFERRRTNFHQVIKMGDDMIFRPWVNLVQCQVSADIDIAEMINQSTTLLIWVLNITANNHRHAHIDRSHQPSFFFEVMGWTRPAIINRVARGGYEQIREFK